MAKKTKIVEVKQPEKPQTRNEMMFEAKARGIKNFRVLNKEELMHVLAGGITQQEVDAIVAGAVSRWKAGWGMRGARNISSKSGGEE